MCNPAGCCELRQIGVLKELREEEHEQMMRILDNYIFITLTSDNKVLEREIYVYH